MIGPCAHVPSGHALCRVRPGGDGPRRRPCCLGLFRRSGGGVATTPTADAAGRHRNADSRHRFADQSRTSRSAHVEPTPGGTYVVQPGDSLSLDRRAIGISWQLIAEANSIAARTTSFTSARC